MINNDNDYLARTQQQHDYFEPKNLANHIAL